jgi:hypothetical protein
MGWRVFAASATGSSHREDGRPCQDASAHRVHGDALVAAVCDGAGSCELGHLGAALVSQAVVDALASCLGESVLRPDTSAASVKTLVEAAVAGARERLQAVATGSARELGAYASTLVAVVAWPGHGLFVHVGDGYAVARSAVSSGPDIVSLPENGEYVNETYFVTGEEWRQHLRTVLFDQPIAAVVLMSDGAAPFAMAKGHQELHRPFIDPVERYLDQVSEAEGAQALAGTLGDPRTDTITNDDKTLLIARWA